MLSESVAQTFTDNHNKQRGHGGGSYLTYFVFKPHRSGRQGRAEAPRRGQRPAGPAAIAAGHLEGQGFKVW